jgi:ribonuclease BN (tRNA processing enzyme)
VRSDAATIWLDAGNGTLANLQRHVGLEDVDAIVLSHNHGDHLVDAEAFHVAVKYGDEPREGIAVFAPAEVIERLDDKQPTFMLHQVADGDRREFRDVALTFSRTDHMVETLAVRLESGGKVLGYSADSGSGWSMESLGPGIDLALCEATFLQDREGSVQHFSARQAGTTARAAGARRLVITHIWPTLDHAASQAEAEAAFGAPVEVAAIDAVYTV